MRPSPSNPTTTTFTYSSPPPSPSSLYSSGGGLRNLKSPIPYLFGGLAFTLALIAIALIILACSYRKQPSSAANSSGCDDEEAGKVESAKTTSDSEPRILVIMAGQSNPTFLAKPLSSSSATIQETS